MRTTGAVAHTAFASRTVGISIFIVLASTCSFSSAGPPTDKVQAEGAIAVFSCSHEQAVSIGWTVNNEEYSRYGSLTSGNEMSMLTIQAPSNFDELLVTCHVTFFNGSTVNYSANLSIQGMCAYTHVCTLNFLNEHIGPLENVKNITSLCNGNFLDVQWNSPKSLNLTEISASEPNIQYRIMVFRNDGLRVTVVNDTVKTTSYELNIGHLDHSYLYQFVIVPISNVEGAKFGRESERIPILCTLGNILPFI